MRKLNSQKETEMVFTYIEKIDFIAIINSCEGIDTINNKLWILYSELENNMVVYEIYYNTDLIHFDYRQKHQSDDESIFLDAECWIDLNIGRIIESEFTFEIDSFFNSINVVPMFLGLFYMDNSVDLFKKVKNIYSKCFFESNDYYEILDLIYSFQEIYNQYQLTLGNLIKFEKSNTFKGILLNETIDSYKLKLYILKISISNGKIVLSKHHTLENMIKSKCS
ncbi:hypothetical protein [Flavobacterium sp. N1719]|uniref:hypothetical protein n=1 Tax=Flavobacterium sp. N1719 TaxID=2885633 RepID=UPI002222A621|nr:hypothetical protein [Flavobacterium sp. N1719]